MKKTDPNDMKSVLRVSGTYICLHFTGFFVVY